jgi:putative phosphoribosyl transferase
VFEDRDSAGRLLAEAVAVRTGGAPACLYGLVRGGVIVAAPIAARLGAILELMIVARVPAPDDPEVAVGAVSEGGGVSWDPDAIEALALGAEWRRRAVAAALVEIERRRARFRTRPITVDPAAIAVVVDDGIATGSTVLAALHGLAARGARRRAVATPVASREAIARIRPEVEWIEVLEAPERFTAVGELYLDFEPVEDDAVTRMFEGATLRR